MLRHSIRLIGTHVLACAILIALTSLPTTAAEKSVRDITIPTSAEGLTGNKKMVFDTWLAFWRGDIEAGLANMADDVTWFIPGTMPTSGMKTGKDGIRKFRQNNLTIFSKQRLDVRGVYGDGNVVVLEVSTVATLANGQPYENAGVTVWDIADGKIQHVREYVDTQKAMAIAAMFAQKPPSP
jgi:ketosteroid isomerase-like protein